MTYLATVQPKRRLQRRRRTLGDAFTDSIEQGIAYAFNPVAQYNSVTNAYDWLVAPPAPPTPPSSYIPGSTYSDYVMNAVTGQPTQNQLTYVTSQVEQSAANDAAVLQSQGVTPPPQLNPATVAAQATADMNAYANAIGGTAQQNLLAPGGVSISTWAWIILGGTAGLIFLMQR